jgi:hypothetical protein
MITKFLQSIDPDNKIAPTLENPPALQAAGQSESSTTDLASTDAANEPDSKLVDAYKNLYIAQNAAPSDTTAAALATRQQELQSALQEDGATNLTKNKEIAQRLSDGSKREKVSWILGMIEDVEDQLKQLRRGLESLYGASNGSPAITDVIKTTVKGPGQDKGQDLVATHYAESDSQFADSSECFRSHSRPMLNYIRVWSF